MGRNGSVQDGLGQTGPALEGLEVAGWTGQVMGQN